LSLPNVQVSRFDPSKVEVSRLGPPNVAVSRFGPLKVEVSRFGPPQRGFNVSRLRPLKG